MDRWTAFGLLFVACASAPRSDGVQRAVFEGYSVDTVREAARVVVEEVAPSMSVVRVTEEGSVFTEGRIGDCAREVTCAAMVGDQGNPGPGATPWTTIEVRLRDLATATAVEVEIVYEDCGPAVDCEPQRLASTGALERTIVKDIRTRLESPEAAALVGP